MHRTGFSDMDCLLTGAGDAKSFAAAKYIIVIVSKKEALAYANASFGGEGGTRTLAPLFRRPTPLAGAPRHQLEYFSG